jgi:hypothetical protein
MSERCPYCGKLKTTESLDPCTCDSSPNSSYRPSLGIRFGILLGLFIIFSLFAIGVFGSPKVIVGFYLLPIGLAAFGGSSPASSLFITASYLIYTGLLASLFILSGRWLLISFFILCVILSISLVGCGKMMSSFSGIH